MIAIASQLIRRGLRFVSLGILLAVSVLMKSFLGASRICVTVMDPRLFGHQSLEPEVFALDQLAAQEAGSSDHLFCCLGRKKLASNRYLWQFTKGRYRTVPSWLVTDAVFWKQRIELPNLEVLRASIYRLNLLTSQPTTLPKNSSTAARSREILSRLKEPHRPHVIFTVREDSCFRELRNRKIDDFRPAMAALVARGFNVVRLTSRSNDPLVGHHDYILDWQVLVNGEPGDELALMSEASFVVSTTTGGDALALAYRKPVLYIDSARFFLMFLGTELATIQIPEMVDTQNGRTLVLQDILTRGLGWSGEQSLFIQKGVRVIRSSPEEIRSCVMEYLDLLTSGKVEASESQSHWRRALEARHGPQIASIHGEIRARLLPSSRLKFVPMDLKTG